MVLIMSYITRKQQHRRLSTYIIIVFNVITELCCHCYVNKFKHISVTLMIPKRVISKANLNTYL